MPTPAGVIDQFLHPPLGLLNPVLDEAGPYGPGTSTRNTFTTSGAFLLPAGTYNVSGTYGVIATVNGPIPVTAGFDDGWDDAGYSVITGTRYYDRFAQINVIHQLLSGAPVITQQFDLDTITKFVLFDVALPAAIGIWCNPFMSIDLFYLCIL